MHPEHERLLAEITAAAPGGSHRGGPDDSYLSSGHTYYRVSVPDRRNIARAWLREHRAWTSAQVRDVVDSLLAGESHEEKTLATMLIRDHAPLLGSVQPDDIDGWLEHLVGWAEIDSLCQSSLSATTLLARWPAWRGAIRQWARSDNVNTRRAALVLLTGPVRASGDPRLRELAFEVTSELQGERPILITKAVSWLLRALTTRHPDAVAAYLEANQQTLPKIALRETRIKLATGTKTGRRRVRD